MVRDRNGCLRPGSGISKPYSHMEISFSTKSIISCFYLTLKTSLHNKKSSNYVNIASTYRKSFSYVIMRLYTSICFTNSTKCHSIHLSNKISNVTLMMLWKINFKLQKSSSVGFIATTGK